MHTKARSRKENPEPQEVFMNPAVMEERKEEGEEGLWTCPKATPIAFPFSRSQVYLEGFWLSMVQLPAKSRYPPFTLPRFQEAETVILRLQEDF